MVLESYISPFEMNYSGLIKTVFNYLITTDEHDDHANRLRIFYKLFAESTVSKRKLDIFLLYCILYTSTLFIYL